MLAALSLGDTPIAIGALAAVGGLVYGFHRFLSEVDDRRKSQAVLVSAWYETPPTVPGYLLKYLNASQEPVQNLIVWLTDWAEDSDGQVLLTPRRPILRGDVVPPGGEGRATIGDKVPAQPYTPTVEVEFSDTRGHRWLRDGSGRLHLLNPWHRRARDWWAMKRGKGPAGC